ncbi:protein ecdysoneless homolog [Chanos chanos]|uniref:Protein ecdysoneless homolog n=1 Tax=Chanos chanos TaxID=29144 RepID=A0A6J2WJ44_CHACN|nr:protein ecdysoneless homolog [Chanos chanos]
MDTDLLRRPALPEDAVQYRLFLVQTGPNTQTGEELLQRLQEKILAEFAPLLVPYIWQQQPFNLKYYPEKGGVPAHLGGSTEFGDNVEDEWFIVYLLRQITQTFPELTATVQDNDGQFLLIEAADYLPKWLNPETSENRVFLYRGELHILPNSVQSGEVGWPKGKVPSVSQALEVLSSHSKSCLANQKIQSSLRRRLQGFPEKIQLNLHRAHCYLPAGIAVVLSQRPDLLAPAVSAFYLRDPIDLQACRTFKYFPPDTRVLTSVTFTRCLYAQLQQQSFVPDRRSGFTLPPRSHPQYRAHELGMKLAHGFEILCSKCEQTSVESDSPASCSPFWKGFLDSLKKNGYFRGELEGSACYKELMTSAETFFKQSFTSTQSAVSPGQVVLQVLQSAPYSLEELRKKEEHLPPEDSDNWLDLTPQDLEHLLEERGGRGVNEVAKERKGDIWGGRIRGDNVEKEEEEVGYSLVAVTQGMKNFINAMSSHEGAELPQSYTVDPFSFDPDAVTSALDRLLGGKEEELDSDDLDDDDDDDEDNDDDDEEEEEREEDVACPGPRAGADALESLRGYMEEMDKELQTTNVGQSFTRINKGGVRTEAAQSSTAAPGSEQQMEEIQPLDVDLNLVTNLLESLSSQAGLSGPASNLLQSMGIHLPPNADPS